MANLISPPIDWGGTGPQSPEVVVPSAQIAPGGNATYTGGILPSPEATQLLPLLPEGETMFVWQNTITDEAGNIVPGAGVEVRLSATNQLMPLYANRAGTITLANPFTADEDGFARFYVPAAIYRVRAFAGGLERVWADVLIGVPLEAIVEATGPLFSSQQAQITSLSGAVGAVEADLAGLIADSRPAAAGTVAADGTSTGFPVSWTTSRVSTGLFEIVHGLGTTAYQPKIQPRLTTDTDRVFGAVIVQKLSNSFRYRIASISDESDGGTDVAHEVAVFLPPT